MSSSTSALGYNCNTSPTFQRNVCIYEKTHSWEIDSWVGGTGCSYDCLEHEHQNEMDNTTDWSRSSYYHTYTSQHIPGLTNNQYSTNDVCINKSETEYISCEEHIHKIPSYHLSACTDIPTEQFFKCFSSNHPVLLTSGNLTQQKSSTSPAGNYSLQKCQGLTGEQAQKCFDYQNYNQMWNQNLQMYRTMQAQKTVCVDRAPDGTCRGTVSAQDYAKATQSQQHQTPQSSQSSSKQVSNNNFFDNFFNFLEKLLGTISNNSPFQNYKINTKCQLSYFLLDLRFTKKQPIEAAIPQSSDYQNQVKNRALELFMQLKEKAKGEDIAQRQKDFEDIRYQLFDEFRFKPFMEHNSINPSLKSIIRPWLLTIDSFSPIQNPDTAPQVNYNILRLTDADYAEDPQCAAIHKKYFSNTMEWLKKQWGY